MLQALRLLAANSTLRFESLALGYQRNIWVILASMKKCNSHEADVVRKTLGLLVGMLSIAYSCTYRSAEAANGNSMPKPAPSFKRHSVEVHDAAPAETSFRVQVAPNSTPSAALSGQVSTEGDTVIKTSVSQVGSSTSVPPEIFRAWLEQTHPKFALSTSTMSQTKVLEVKGVYDNSSKTLRALGIPFTRISGGDIEDMSLADTRVIVINCPGRVPRSAQQRLRDFVAQGGYVLCTDWSSDNVIDGAFPGYIQWDKHTNKQSVYDAEVVHPDSSLFARTVSNSSWKMDIDSHMIRVLRPDVRVLAISKQLSNEDSQGKGVLAVVFPFGRGYVMHMVAHFDNNTIMSFRNMLADPAPVIGISLRQALATNFVVAGLSGTRIPIR